MVLLEALESFIKDAMSLDELTKEELIEFGEGRGISLDINDNEQVLIAKINEVLEKHLEKNGFVELWDDYRTYCAFCNKKISSEKILPDGYEEMFSTMAIEYCESCYEKYEE